VLAAVHVPHLRALRALDVDRIGLEGTEVARDSEGKDALRPLVELVALLRLGPIAQKLLRVRRHEASWGVSNGKARDRIESGRGRFGNVAMGGGAEEASER